MGSGEEIDALRIGCTLLIFLDPLGGLDFRFATNFANEYNSLGVIVVFEDLESIDKVSSREYVSTHTDT